MRVWFLRISTPGFPLALERALYGMLSMPWLSLGFRSWNGSFGLQPHNAFRVHSPRSRMASLYQGSRISAASLPSSRESRRWLTVCCISLARCPIETPKSKRISWTSIWSGLSRSTPMLAARNTRLLLLLRRLFPTQAHPYQDIGDALYKLQLSDSVLTFEPDSSSAMLFRFYCGFLVLFHVDRVL